MKKISSVTVCYVLSVLLLLGFIVNTIVDYGRYNRTLNSAPFYIWIVVNVLIFIVPSIIALIVGIVIKSKRKSNGV